MNPYDLFRPLLFRFDPETIHKTAMTVADATLGTRLGRLATPLFEVSDARLTTRAFGIDFPSPVGLAAGFDKNAEHVIALSRLGFGHIEIGTVTGRAQPGNDRPRLFRLTADRALLNRMGFNNQGSEAVERRLSRLRYPGILGVNIGKTKVVPLAEATDDYETSFRRLWPFASYFVVNVSSPNTPGLRDLQSKEPLTRLLRHLQTVNEELGGDERRPLLVKIAPDLTHSQLDDVMDVVQSCRLDGVVATNTTIARSGLQSRGQDELGPGGVSGRPLTDRSREIVRYIRGYSPELPIIGVGGIFDATDALQMLAAGATLIQVWTGFIYRGPTIVRDINRGLLAACEENGWDNVSEASGLF